MPMSNISLKSILLTLAGSSLIFLSACGGGEPAVPPTAEQLSELTRIVRACKKVEGKQHLSHLSEYRKKYGTSFTCEDLENACSANYLGNECVSARTEIAVETAFEKACRRNQSAQYSAACSKLTKACNVEGFQSAACQSAVQIYQP